MLSLNRSIKYLRIIHHERTRKLFLLTFLIVFGYTIVFMTGMPAKFFGRKHAKANNQDNTVKIPTDIDTEWKLAKFLENSLDCQRVFNGDLAYAFERKFFIVDPPHEELPMDCESILRRNGLQQNGWLLRESSEAEKQFPLAFARIVFKDYVFLESELAVNYAPQNWYCYAVDIKSDQLFRERIHQLAKCLPNVIVTQRELNISSQGHNTSDAMVDCARELAQLDGKREWKYLITLQNHDIQAKTNAELTNILEWFDGANDIEFGRLDLPSINERVSFYINGFDWSFKNLALFRNESKNNRQNETTTSDSDGEMHMVNDTIVRVSKGYSTASLSREFVDFIVHQLNLDKMLEQLNKAPFGVDEHIWQSLCATDTIKAPGCLPMDCYNDNGVTTTTPFFYTRFALWQDDMQPLPCQSGNFRHYVCVFGLEDLTGSALFDLPNFFLNKMMPDYDYGAIKCWHERMRQRRRMQSAEGALLNTKDGGNNNLTQTRYGRMKNVTNGVNLRRLECA